MPKGVPSPLRRIPNCKLLTTTNPKALKGVKGLEYLSAVLMLSPAKRSGFEMCPFASPGCIMACLNTAGYGEARGASQAAIDFADNIQAARIRRTILFKTERAKFWKLLIEDIERLGEFAGTHNFSGEFYTHRRSSGVIDKRPLFSRQNKGMKLCIRLNGTSDIQFEKIEAARGKRIMELFPAVQFYDYTKIPRRFERPRNYHLTYSRHELERSAADSADYFRHGINTTVVFDIPLGGLMVGNWQGRGVFDGRSNDLRFLDPAEKYIGLSPLGRARDDQSGFVVRLRTAQSNPPKDTDGTPNGTDLFPDFEE